MIYSISTIILFMNSNVLYQICSKQSSTNRTIPLLLLFVVLASPYWKASLTHWTGVCVLSPGQPPSQLTLQSEHTRTLSPLDKHSSLLCDGCGLSGTTVFRLLNISARAQMPPCAWLWLFSLASLCAIFAPVLPLHHSASDCASHGYLMWDLC